MGRHLPPDETELYRRIDEVLHYLWDPLGVAGVPQARDEYDWYLARVFSLLRRRAPAEEIISFLVTTQTETMALGGAKGARDRAAPVVRILQEWSNVIAERTSSS